MSPVSRFQPRIIQDSKFLDTKLVFSHPRPLAVKESLEFPVFSLVFKTQNARLKTLLQGECSATELRAHNNLQDMN